MRKIPKTVTLYSEPLTRKEFQKLKELEGMYRNMLLQATMYAVQNNVSSFVHLKSQLYKTLRNLYPQLPSHYAYTVCQDAALRSKSFLKRKKKGLAKKQYPNVNKISIWLDDHLWKPGILVFKITTHKGWVEVEFNGHKHYWKTINLGYELASQARIRLDHKNKRVILHLTFYKPVPIPYEPADWISVDVNENNVTALIGFEPVMFYTGVRKITLGYALRRKKIQKKSKHKRTVMKKLHEKDKKVDIRRKIANIIVEEALKRKAGIVLERLPKNAPRKMVNKIKNKGLRHRIYQSALLSVQREIVHKAEELGVPVKFVNPAYSSSFCPFHESRVVYVDSSRVGV